MKHPILTTVMTVALGALGTSAWAAGDATNRTTPNRAADGTMSAPANGTNSTQPSRSAGQVVSDASITAKVKASLIGDETTKARQINVDTSRGVVKLTGAVDSQAAVDRAVQIARSTEGVHSVQNQLTVGTR
ncbi:MAG: BON domain-containing protein [Burkholderiales bacterium]|nr:BON domain-containing protein [Burkholderiales bacterium]